MKIAPTVNAHCKKCKTHTPHKVKVTTSKIKPGRTLAWGSLKHERKLAGYHGKVKGKAKVKKQGIRNRIMMECTVCHKKHERVISGRMTKKVELNK